MRYTLTNNAGGTPQVNNTGIFTNVGAGVYKVSIADLTTGCATVTGADIDVTDAMPVNFTLYHYGGKLVTVQATDDL